MKIKKAKVGYSAGEIMRKLYPPLGQRPETLAYIAECERRWKIDPMVKV